MKTGMLCAEALFDAVTSGRQHDELSAYPASFEKSWLKEELDTSKNFKQWFKKGMYVGMIMTGIEQWLIACWASRSHLDHSPHRSRSHSPVAAAQCQDRLSGSPMARSLSIA